MRIDLELVARVARLAALDVSPEEAETLSVQLTRIVSHFEALRSIPDELLSGIPDSQPSPLREDRAVDAGERGFVASNAPEFSHGHFVVPRVVSR